MNDSLLLLINGWAGKSSILDSVMVVCARDLIYGVFFVALICLGILLYRREWRPVIYFFVSIVVTFGVLKLMALLTIDHRPFMDHKLTQLIPHATGASFPSDHTTSSAAVALGVLIFTRFKKVGTLLLMAACVIGFSRIFVGVHYPADIAGGLITALIGAGIVALVKKLIEGDTTPKVAFDPK
jgi:undecaprenyl-diphosphatase